MIRRGKDGTVFVKESSLKDLGRPEHEHLFTDEQTVELVVIYDKPKQAEPKEGAA